MKVEQTRCSETSAHKIQTPGNHPKEGIPHSQHDSLKSRKIVNPAMILGWGRGGLDFQVLSRLEELSVNGTPKCHHDRTVRRGRRYMKN